MVSGSITKFFSIDFVIKWSIDRFFKRSIDWFFSIFYFNRFCPMGKCGIAPHGLYSDSWTLIYSFHSCLSMRKTCPNAGFFWSVFSRIWTECGPEKFQIWVIVNAMFGKVEVLVEEFFWENPVLYAYLYLWMRHSFLKKS